MSLMDGLLVTLVNTVACIALPKLLSIALAARSQIKNVSSTTISASAESNAEMASFS